MPAKKRANATATVRSLSDSVYALKSQISSNYSNLRKHAPLKKKSNNQIFRWESVLFRNGHRTFVLRVTLQTLQALQYLTDKMMSGDLRLEYRFL